MKACYEADLYKVLHVNTHKSKIVVGGAIFDKICEISDVDKVASDGSYGMELFIIHQAENEDDIIKQIEDILE